MNLKLQIPGPSLLGYLGTGLARRLSPKMLRQKIFQHFVWANPRRTEANSSGSAEADLKPQILRTFLLGCLGTRLARRLSSKIGVPKILRAFCVGKPKENAREILE